MCGGSRAYLILARESRLPGRRGQKLPQNSPARRPRWTSKASMASRKLVRACHQPRLPPPPYCAAAAARPSDATAGPDRDQRDLLCPPTRVGGAALRGRTIIWHRWTPDRRRVALLLFWLLPRPCNPSLNTVGSMSPCPRPVASRTLLSSYLSKSSSIQDPSHTSTAGTLP